MKLLKQRLLPLLMALLMMLSLASCADIDADDTQSAGNSSSVSDTNHDEQDEKSSEVSSEEESSEDEASEDEASDENSSEESSVGEDENLLDPDGYYYDVESVVLYLHTYGELPANYITKDEARDLGWEGGSVEAYLDEAAIGGDYFGNYEGLLPKASGREYTECDIDTHNYKNRGSRRLIFSNDGLYFYTHDHYESFEELYVDENGEVQWK